MSEYAQIRPNMQWCICNSAEPCLPLCIIIIQSPCFINNGHSTCEKLNYN